MTTDDAVTNALENKNFVQAVSLGDKHGAPQENIHTWQRQALWQIAAMYRNNVAVKILATQYGFSKEQTRELLQKRAEAEAEEKVLKPRYDYSTNQHLDFSQWLDQLFSK